MKEKIKKTSTLTLAIILFVFLFSFKNVSAISGDCSWHGGVDCVAGADWDGSAICNDGWKDSKDGFFDVKECLDKIHCSTSQYESLLQKYGVPGILAEIQSKIQEVSNLSEKVKNTEDYTIIMNILSQVKTLSWSVQQERQLLDQILITVDSECRALGYDNEQQRMLERIKFREELQKQLQVLTPTTTSSQAPQVNTPAPVVDSKQLEKDIKKEEIKGINENQEGNRPNINSSKDLNNIKENNDTPGFIKKVSNFSANIYSSVKSIFSRIFKALF